MLHCMWVGWAPGNPLWGKLCHSFVTQHNVVAPCNRLTHWQWLNPLTLPGQDWPHLLGSGTRALVCYKLQRCFIASLGCQKGGWVGFGSGVWQCGKLQGMFNALEQLGDLIALMWRFSPMAGKFSEIRLSAVQASWLRNGLPELLITWLWQRAEGKYFLDPTIIGVVVQLVI